MTPSPLTAKWHDLERDRLLALQGRKLHRYLRDCVLPFSKHYRRLFEENCLTADDIRSVEDLQKLPFTSKEDLLPSPDRPPPALEFALIPDKHVLARRPSVICRAVLHGRKRVQDELDREWRPTFLTSTTGRSTEAVTFLYTQHDVANLGLGGGRVIDLAGIGREDRIVSMMPFAPHLAFWYMHYAAVANNTFTLSTGGGKVMGTAGNLRALQKIRPQAIVGMPTFIYHVLHEACSQKLRIEGLRIICLGGEKVADGMRRKLAELCAEVGSPEARVIATYGFTECKLAFSECPFPPGETPTGYHLYPDLGIVEVVDPKTGQVVPDGQGGEIVWTPLDQRGTVVLRYRTGDFIEHGLSYEACPCCGRRMPRLLGRISRVSEVRALRFQKLKGTLLDFNELEHALDDIPGIGSWQIELRKAHDDPHDVDEIVLHVARDSDEPEASVKARVLGSLEAEFEVRPNQVVFHSMDQMRVLQEVGVALKEKKLADNRPKDDAPAPPPPSGGPAVRAAQLSESRT